MTLRLQLLVTGKIKPGQECVCSWAKPEWMEQEISRMQADGDPERLNDTRLGFKVKRLTNSWDNCVGKGDKTQAE